METTTTKKRQQKQTQDKQKSQTPTPWQGLLLSIQNGLLKEEKLYILILDVFPARLWRRRKASQILSSPEPFFWDPRLHLEKKGSRVVCVSIQVCSAGQRPWAVATYLAHSSEQLLLPLAASSPWCRTGLTFPRAAQPLYMQTSTASPWQTAPFKA